MRSLNVLAFLFALLPLAVIGHDAYVAYKHPEMGDIIQAFRFSDLGWLWTNYSPDTYGWARENFNESFWRGLLDPILRQTALLIAMLPLIVVTAIMLTSKLTQGVQIVSMAGQRKKTKGFAYGGLNAEKKDMRIKYKRH